LDKAEREAAEGERGGEPKLVAHLSANGASLTNAPLRG